MKRHHLSTSIYITGVYQGERKKMRRKFEKQLSNIMEWEKSETYIMKEEISQRSSVSRNVGIKINYHLLTSIYVTSILSYTVLEDDANDEK